MQTGPSRVPSAQMQAERERRTFPYPYSRQQCPKCSGGITLEKNRTEEGTHWDVMCVRCGATVAFWRTGDDSWTELYTDDGVRIVGCLQSPQSIEADRRKAALSTPIIPPDPEDPDQSGGAPPIPVQGPPPARRGRPRGSVDRGPRRSKTRLQFRDANTGNWVDITAFTSVTSVEFSLGSKQGY